jgi:hypothetical protein
MKTTKSKNKRVATANKKHPQTDCPDSLCDDCLPVSPPATAKAKEWRPEHGSMYWIPCVVIEAKKTMSKMILCGVAPGVDKAAVKMGLACKTQSEANRKAKAALKAAKETE